MKKASLSSPILINGRGKRGHERCNKIFRTIVYSFFCVFIIITFCSCQENISKPLATVDGMQISVGEFHERFTKGLNVSINRSLLTPEDYDLVKEEALHALIDEKIMLLRAGELSLVISDAELESKIEEIRASYSGEGFERVISVQKVNYTLWKEELRKRMLLEKLIASEVNAHITVQESEARKYYRAHKRKYPSEMRVHVAQIVVRDRDKAETLLKMLKSGGDFGKVAREESIGPEAAKGGDLGFVSQGIMPEEIDAAIFSLPIGEISPVIKSFYGHHIFKIIERSEWKKITWSDIKEQVTDDLRKQKEEKAYVRWLETLRSKAAITIDREQLKKVAITLNHGSE
jgi:foldase protein PrsA